MQRQAPLIVFTALASLGSAQAGSEHWGYSGSEGPENWGSLEPGFAMCSIGQNQSPIDVDETIEADLPLLGIDYRAGAASIVNNGHTIQVDVAPGSTLSVGGRQFTLKQFHFHAPGENTIKGERFPLELHLVHADADGHLAVIGVMFRDGTGNAELERVWADMPARPGDALALPAGLDFAGLLPARLDHFQFNGSLTTPPCSEGVRWFVMKQPLVVSEEQVARFTGTIGGANSRPVQPVNARPVLR